MKQSDWSKEGFFMPTIESGSESYLFRLLFKLKVYEASGNFFQSLVSQIFEFAIPGFQRIAPWGSQGDGGNDGWVRSSGHYFQVYGPQNNTQINPVKEIRKAKQDFHKLLGHWPSIRHYSFVLNDRFEGIPGPVPLALTEIKNTHNLDSAQAIGAGDLANFFADLDYDKKCMITGNIPFGQSDFLDTRAVGELLTYLADKPSRRLGFLQQTPPEFKQKIHFNGLSESVGDRLKTANYQVAYVDDFLKTRGAALQQSIGEEIHEMYKDSKEIIPDSEAEAADLRFIWLMKKLIPENIKHHVHSEKAYELAAVTILSKYFETCDIYEYPDSPYPS